MEDKLISTYLLPGVLAFIMLGMGLSLSGKDFRNIALHPRSVLTGLICQMIILPLIAILLAYLAGFAGLSPAFQIGLVLIAACPGGAVSNLISYLLQANVALSVSLTTLNSFLVIFTIPSIVNLALFLFLGSESNADIDLPFWATVLQILIMTVIPCILGIYIRAQTPKLADRLETPLKYLMPILLALAMLGAIFLENGDQQGIRVLDYAGLTLVVFLFNLIGMGLGFYSAKFLNLGHDNQITIAVEVGLQNTALAIAIATAPQFLNQPEMAIPASIYALFTFFSAAIFGVLVKPQLLRKTILRKYLFK